MLKTSHCETDVKDPAGLGKEQNKDTDRAKQYVSGESNSCPDIAYNYIRVCGVKTRPMLWLYSQTLLYRTLFNPNGARQPISPCHNGRTVYNGPDRYFEICRPATI